MVASSWGGEGGGLVSTVRPLARRLEPNLWRARHWYQAPVERQMGQERRRGQQKEQQEWPLGQSMGCLSPTI